MKWLKKLKLINWHYFKDEEISFGKQTMITGRNAAGKSTIIDALQVLFIAKLTMIRFNSSAHDDAKRSIISYLRGKIGSDDRKYIREGDFTTFLMAEFYDDSKQDYFVVGTVIDVYSDDNNVQEYFIVDRCQIGDLDYLKENGKLKNRDEFHRYIDQLKNRSILERTKEGYQRALLHRLGQVNNRFFSTFSKALSFKPIQNVRDFVYDYILDEKELQLDIMKENFEVHQKYKRELEDLVVRQDSLKAIRGVHEQYKKYGEIVEQQEYVIRQLEHLKQQEEIEQMRRGVLSLSDEIKRNQDEIERNDNAFEEAKRASRDAYEKWLGNKDKKRSEELQGKIEKGHTSLNEQSTMLERLLQALRKEREKVQLLSVFPENEFFAWKYGVQNHLNEGNRLLEEIIQTLESGNVPEYNLSTLGEELSKLHSEFVIAKSETSKRIEELTGNQDGLQKEIKDLENRKLRYPESVQNLKSLLEQRLNGKSKVWIFCEEMEVRRESWRNAIEGYLHTQRFDLLVEPAYFEEALHIYETEKWNLKLEGAGLVNTKKERIHLGASKDGSLATEVHSENPVIQARIDHLMGRVIKADSEKELSRHEAAITSSCMLYQNLVARQMKAERYRTPYIGTKAIPRQLELKRAELEEVVRLLRKTKEYKQIFHEWEQHLMDARSQYKEFNERLILPQLITEIMVEVEKFNSELSQLDLEGIKRLEDDYKFWNKEVNELEGKKIELGTNIGIKKDQLVSGEKKIEQQEKALLVLESSIIEWKETNSSIMLQQAEERLKEAENQEVSLDKKLENWRGNQAGNRTRADKEIRRLGNSRHDFNVRHHFNGEEEAVHNEEYQLLLDQIDIDIREYQDKLGEALKQSEVEFASHFVYKMKEAIEGARRQFRLLNESLKQFPFNEESYQFEIKSSDKYKRFYDVIMNLSITDKDTLFDLPDEEQNHALHELFEVLTKGEAIDQEEFTDYRRYLDFDLIITSGSNSKTRFSTVLKEKSGGETQTPFYIAILSSFNQLYNSHKTMRLVVFDEAFNKMDEERIQTSLRLIKNMDFQLIAAVPDEKLSNMAKEVSTIVIVHREGYECFTDMIEHTALLNGGEQSESREDQALSVQDTLFASEKV